jgi:chitodextrinase
MKSSVRVLAVLLFAVSLVAQNATVTPRRVVPRELTPADVAREKDGRRILLGTAAFDPVTERPDYQAVGLAHVGAGAGTEYGIVQLKSATPETRAELERLGVKFFGYLPDNAYQVRIPRTAKAKVAASAAVRWVGDFEPGFKVHPRLWPSRTEEVLTIRVLPFADMSVSKVVALLQKANPAVTITKSVDDQFAQFVEIAIPAGTADDFIRTASAIDGIRWIEPNDGMQYHNALSSGAIQGNKDGDTGRTIWAHGITGTGQIVAVADSGLDSSMCYFRVLNGVDAVTDASIAETDQPGPLYHNNKVIGYWVQSGADAYDEPLFHGTHTAGTVAGDSSAHPSSPTNPGFDTADGMAPNAQILFQDLGAADGNLRGGNPYNMFLQALRGGARVHTNSYGSASKGAYTAYEQLVDRFLFDYDQMSVIFSAGNDGPQAGTTGSPGNAKNTITVGATNAGLGGLVTIFSSRGPTADGRIKPDIMAPGQNIISAGGDVDHNNTNCGTSDKQGTSMSAPTVAGGAALLRQYFADGYYPSGTKKEADGFSPSSTLVKAVLLNGTLGLPATEAIGNPRFGWGKIFLDSNLYFPGDSRKLRVWDLPNAQGLRTGDTRSFTVSVAGGQEFRATLVWMDAEGTPGAAKVLVNDLDLTVTNSAGTYMGNVFVATGDSNTGGNADRLNNVEQVRFTAPVGGTYTITVRGANVPGNGRATTDRQGFALAVSAATCSSSVSAAPGNLQATSSVTRGVDLSWTAPSGSTITQIYRAVGVNPSRADFRYIGSSNGFTFTDALAQGGYIYSYMVRAADDCGEGPLSNPVTITAAGLCDLIPTFSGIASAQADGNNCKIVLNWGTGASNCPAGDSIRYNIYRSTEFDFEPEGTPYATTTSRTFEDTNIVSGTTYHYVVRAEDTTTSSSGPNRGNEDTNLIRLFATAFGAPGATGTWRDTAGDTGAFLRPDVPWQITETQARTGSHSYHNAADNDKYLRNTCAAITTPAISLDANAELSYFVRYNLEWEWDGVIVEISEDGGNTWKDLPPAGGYPGTLADTQGATGTDSPANVCGYLRTQGAFTGPSNNAGLTPWTEYKSSLAAYSGKTVQIRWRFTSDPGAEFEGFYLDDVAIANAKMPGSCTQVITRPAAAFDLVPGLPAKGKPAQFRDRSTNTPTSWSWQFGDGGTSTQQNPTHTYDATGTYTVTLTVTNAAGTHSVSRTVTVSEPGDGGKRRSVR